MEKFVNALKKLILKINSPIDNQKVSFQTKEKIITLTEKIFLNSEEKQFQTILINYIVKPVYSKFAEIENLKQSSSRTKRPIIGQYQQVKPLIEQLFEDYKHFLKEEKEYIQYQDNLLNKERNLMNLIFKNLDYDVDYLESSNLGTSKNQVLKFLDQLNNKSNYLDLKYKVVRVHTKIKEVKARLRKDIDRVDTQIKDTTTKLNSGIDYQTDYNNYTYKEILEQNLVDYQFEQDFYTNHFKLLDSLKNSIERKFPFIEKDNIISLLKQFMPHEKTNRFLQIEDRLIEHKYLIKDEIGLKWNRKKNELVNFCRFLESEGFLKQHKKISLLIKFLEDRYDTNVGDQRKENKFDKDRDLKSEFEFINYYS